MNSTSKLPVVCQLSIMAARRGEFYGKVVAISEGRQIGFVQFSEHENEVWIKYAQVDGAHRRQGVATAMYQKLRDEFPGENIVSSGTTDEGGALRRSLTERGVVGAAKATADKYYHGTDNEAAAQAILKNGIQPRAITMPEKAKSRAQMAPMPDHVYLTTSKSYASIYALGGQCFGMGLSDQTKTNYTADMWLKNHLKDGEYGYIFEIDGSTVTGDMVPDEDSIGEALYWALDYRTSSQRLAELERGVPERWTGERDRLLRTMAIIKEQPITKAPEDIQRMLRSLYHRLNETQKHRLEEAAIQAQVGKKLQRYLQPQVAKWLIDNGGAHVAHLGPVYPTKAWRFSKKDALYTRDLDSLLEDVQLQPTKTAAGTETPLRPDNEYEENSNGYALDPEHRKDAAGMKLRWSEIPSSGVTGPTPNLTQERWCVEAFVGNESLGTVDIIDLGNGIAQTESLLVWPEHRGSGHARQLYELLFQQLKERGFKEIHSSDLLHEGGQGVWESLQREHPIRYENGRFKLKLGNWELFADEEELRKWAATYQNQPTTLDLGDHFLLNYTPHPAENSDANTWNLWNEGERVGEVVVDFYPDLPHPSIRNIRLQETGKGIGRRVVQALAHFYGGLTSDPQCNTNEAAKKMWRGLPGVEEVPSNRSECGNKMFVLKAGEAGQ